MIEELEASDVTGIEDLLPVFHIASKSIAKNLRVQMAEMLRSAPKEKLGSLDVSGIEDALPVLHIASESIGQNLRVQQAEMLHSTPMEKLGSSDVSGIEDALPVRNIASESIGQNLHVQQAEMLRSATIVELGSSDVSGIEDALFKQSNLLERSEPLDLSAKRPESGSVAIFTSGADIPGKFSKSTHSLSKPRNPKVLSYTESSLHDALNEIQNHTVSIYTASKKYGIPRTTLQYRLSDEFKHKGTKGPYTVFSSNEEMDIVKWLQNMERKGFPITKNCLTYKVQSYLKMFPRSTPFTNDTPGKTWFKLFIKRHPELSIRTPESVTAASSKVSENDIRNWFRSVYSYLEDNKLTHILDDPTRILNGDETGFSLNPVPKQVIGTAGNKNVSFVESTNSKVNVTVMFTFSADGTVIPPDVILPRKRFSREILRSFPGDWGLGSSENGWMDTHNFIMYIKKILYPTLVKMGTKLPVIFFVDGHSSHTALEAADTCRQLGIILIALCPNATRILQPADVAIFRPLKINWSKALDTWRSDHIAERMTLTTFGPLLEKTMAESFKKSTIISGFSTCGLFPFSPEAIDFSKCIAKGCDDQIEDFVPQNDKVNYGNLDYGAESTRFTVETPCDTACPAEDAIPTAEDHVFCTTNISSYEDQIATSDSNNLRDSQQTHVLVPRHLMRKAVEMLGHSKISLFLSDQEHISHEDKVLSYMYRNILVLSNPNAGASNDSTIGFHDTTDTFHETVDNSVVISVNVDEGPFVDTSIEHSLCAVNQAFGNKIISCHDIGQECCEPTTSGHDGSAKNITESIESDDQGIGCNSVNILDTIIDNQTVDDLSFSLEDDLLDCVSPTLQKPVNITLTDFLTTPNTPKRASIHRNYKQKSYAVLTAAERLTELTLKDNMKEEAERLRMEKLEMRKVRKLEIEEEKRTKQLLALKRKAEKEEDKRQKKEAKKIKMEAKTKQTRNRKQNLYSSSQYTSTAAGNAKSANGIKEAYEAAFNAAHKAALKAMFEVNVQVGDVHGNVENGNTLFESIADARNDINNNESSQEPNLNTAFKAAQTTAIQTVFECSSHTDQRTKTAGCTQENFNNSVQKVCRNIDFLNDFAALNDELTGCEDNYKSVQNVTMTKDKREEQPYRITKKHRGEEENTFEIEHQLQGTLMSSKTRRIRKKTSLPIPSNGKRRNVGTKILI